ncbi:MAG: hypothetical protein V1928_00365 [Parcubacteria group bacterium]
MSLLISKLGVIAIVFLSLIFFINTAKACSVSPSELDLRLEGGDFKIGYITLKSASPQRSEYTVTSQNFTATGKEGRLDFIQPNNVFQDSDWITPEKQTILLEGRDTRELKYMIRIPEDAEVGGHYIALLFSSTSTDEAATVGRASAKIGVFFYLEVVGNSIENSEIESFNLLSYTNINRLPLTFETVIKNSGNVHIKPEGEIIINNFLGKTAATIPLNPDSLKILPNGARRLESEWSGKNITDPVRTSNWFHELKNEWHNFAFGPYIATVHGRYGAGEHPLQAQLKFWVIPWRIITLFLALLLFLVILQKLYKFSIRKRLIRQAHNNHK